MPNVRKLSLVLDRLHAQFYLLPQFYYGEGAPCHPVLYFNAY